MELFFREVGQGKPVIILPGLLGMADNWLSFAKNLAHQFKLYLVELRNHGRSFHSELFTYEAMAADIKSFIKHHHLTNPVIIGHSMGGKVAMQLAQSYTKILTKLIVVDIAPKAYPVQAFVQLFKTLQRVPLAHMHTRAAIETYLKDLIPDIAFRQFIVKNLRRNAQGTFTWWPNIRGIAANLAQIGKAIPFQAPFLAPTLFVRGSHSNYIQEADLPSIKKMFPHYLCKTIAHATHWIHYEQPGALLEVIANFLTC